MNRGLVLEFTKMHGAGNDFIVIDNRFFFFSSHELSEIARKFCPRHFGIGADGLLALELPRLADAHYHMAYVNADGSPGEMCGNGARCLARFAYESGIEERPLRFSTTAGSYEAFVDPTDQSRVRVVLPAPSIVEPNFATVQIGSDALALTFVDVGVPHAVWFGTRIDRLPVHEWGAYVRNHPDFEPTRGANVDFVEVTAGDGHPELSVRCYERGVEGETLACGTGAVSSFAAAGALGLVDTTEAKIRMRGGTLLVGYTSDKKGIYLEGPAETVYRGSVVL